MPANRYQFPRVSIQIPTYNQEAFIQKTIESCLMQDYANLEINIADDNSTDDTNKVVEPFLNDKRVRYFNNEVNIGMVANYHKALYEYATGDWAINLDGDDYFTDPSFISRAIEQIQKSKDESIFVYQANQKINKIMKVLPACERIDEETILVEGAAYFMNYYKILNFHHCATLYKRHEALKLNFYTFNCLYTDFNSVAKLFVLGKIILFDKEVAIWSRHDQNLSSTLNEEKLKNEFAAIDELACYAQKKIPVKLVQKWGREMKAYLLSNYIDLLSTKKQKRSALKTLFNNFSFELSYFKLSAKTIFNLIGIK